MNLKHFLSAAINRLKLSDITSSHIDRTAKVMGGCRIDQTTLGRYTYVGGDSRIIRTSIGSFSSIAGGVRIGGGSHAMQFVSTSPVFAEGKNILGTYFAAHSFDPYCQTIIGNDVWIGADAHIKGGITIGHGAIIGMGAVVTKDVGPYEVWAGNPARLIKKRFDDETIQKLLDIRWWDWPLDKIQGKAQYFNDVQKLISEEYK